MVNEPSGYLYRVELIRRRRSGANVGQEYSKIMARSLPLDAAVSKMVDLAPMASDTEITELAHLRDIVLEMKAALSAFLTFRLEIRTDA